MVLPVFLCLTFLLCWCVLCFLFLCILCFLCNLCVIMLSIYLCICVYVRTSVSVCMCEQGRPLTLQPSIFMYTHTGKFDWLLKASAPLYTAAKSVSGNVQHQLTKVCTYDMYVFTHTCAYRSQKLLEKFEAPAHRGLRTVIMKKGINTP